MKRLILAILIGGILGAILILILMLVFRDKRTVPAGLQLVTSDTTGTKDSRSQQVLVYGDYMDLDSTEYLLIPLGMKTLDENEGRGLRSKSSDEYTVSNYNGSYRSYKYNFYSLEFGNCNNIIFYNKLTEETHLLLQKPAIISQFYFPYYNKEYTGKKYWFILLGIREDDSNADGYINTYDAEKVYLADLSGKRMIQITPDNTQLVDWFIDMSTNNILMKVRYDSNKDLRFNYYDEIEILKTSIDNPSEGKEIIGQPIREDIRNILNKIK